MADLDPRPVVYDPIRGFKWGALILTAMTAGSTLIYWLLGQWYDRPDWNVLDCLFMVVITLSTIGYGDWLNIRPVPAAQVFTIGLVVLGVGVHAFVVSNVTALMFEGLFGSALRRRKMREQIDHLSGHVIVCGAGATGTHCIGELERIGHPFCVVDTDGPLLERLAQSRAPAPLLYVVGQAEEDEVLRLAGVERASGLLSCLDDDKLNLFVTLSARQLNPKLRIVSKAIEDPVVSKLRRAGADDVVSPSAIGGLRMVSAMVRPTVIGFLDTMMRDPTQSFRFEELRVAPGCLMEGRTIAQAALRRHGDVLAVAVREPGSPHFVYSPGAAHVLSAGTVLVVLARREELGALRREFQPPADSAA